MQIQVEFQDRGYKFNFYGSHLTLTMKVPTKCHCCVLSDLNLSPEIGRLGKGILRVIVMTNEENVQ